MPENKHAEISKLLEQEIRSGKYFERIPPVRTLARQFNVSLQTMNKALKPLQNSGLLVSGPGGTRINENIPYSLHCGVVSVFMLGSSLPQTPISEDMFLQALQQEANNDGVTLLMMWVENEEIFRNQSFWESRQTDGYIFVYSSFYPLLSKHLHVSGVPYVIGNWLPDSFNAHYVDWDWKKQLFDLVKLLQENGFSKIAYMPNLHWEFGFDFHYDMWQDVCSSYELHNYSPDKSSFGIPPSQQLTKIIADPAGPPEVIIPTNIDCSAILQQLDSLGVNCRLAVNSGYLPIINDKRMIYYSANDYRKLASELWKVFRKISNGTAGPPRGHLITSGKITISNFNK
ncbi:MAG: GntR family transcriptional regulator [Lentisphaerae bacterium]|nr:GntR family transcriptional regulator [Lentisphaerota bacterium]